MSVCERRTEKGREVGGRGRERERERESGSKVYVQVCVCERMT